MKEIIRKSIQITNMEGFNGIKNKIILNICMIILLIIFQLYDISVQITGNYIAVIWIAINSYYVCSIFFKDNRKSILILSSLSNSQKIFLLFFISFITNLPYYLYIIIQLSLLKANIIHTVYISTLQYIFGIIIGTVSGFFSTANIGIIIIIILGFINFSYNIYNYNASNHIFSISEMIYSVNSVNITNILGFILIIIGGIGTLFTLFNSNNKYGKFKLMFLASILFLIYLGGLYVEFFKYEKIQNSEYKTFSINGHNVKYRGISENTAKNISKIGIQLEKEYKNFTKNKKNKNYIINKMFLSDISWNLKNKKIKPFIFSKDTIEINILSDSMINFENPDLMRNFIEIINTEFVNDILNTENNKYILHLMDGYPVVVLRNVSQNFDFGENTKISRYYEKELEEILVSSFQKYSFTKRIAVIAYNKYPEKATLLYQKTIKMKPETDKDFVELLKKDFNELYNDKDIIKIIQIIFENQISRENE